MTKLRAGAMLMQSRSLHLPMPQRILSTATLLACHFAALAQLPAPPTDFPADAKPVAADVLLQRLAGKVFNVKPAASSAWRLQFQAGGHYFVNLSSGYSDDGPWRVEESRLCTAPQKARASCNEMRLAGDTLYLKRDSGEVVRFEPN